MCKDYDTHPNISVGLCILYCICLTFASWM